MRERGRKKADPIDDLETWPYAYVTVPQLSDYTGISARTIRWRCKHGLILAERRGLKPESEWRITIAEARRVEQECGLTVKRPTAA